jgi:ubiquinone/menaquinone biosynthesis C-methylase UbiE
LGDRFSCETAVEHLNQFLEFDGLQITSIGRMFRISQLKEADVEVEFQQGNVADIPFPDNTFDFIICTAAFKNFKDHSKELNQIYRDLFLN